MSTPGLLWGHGMYTLIIDNGFSFALYNWTHVHLPVWSLVLDLILPVNFPWTIVTVPPGWYLDSKGIGTLAETMLVDDHMVLVLLYIVSYASAFLVL